MWQRLLWIVSCACWVACAGEPDERSLRESFARQIGAVDHVQDFERRGDVITFRRPDGSGELINWRIEIESARVEPHDAEGLPYRGFVSSSWFLNDRRVASSPTSSDLPAWILETGLGQECWAFWESAKGAWGWT